MELVVILWIGLLILFLVVEAACPLHLVSLWFAVGSLAALGVYALGGAFWLQILVFCLVSGVLLVALWPLSKRFLKPNIVSTNIDAVVGSAGYVTIAIDNLKAEGQVKLAGMEWTARSTSGKVIPAGTLVKVDRIEGVKAFVSEAEVPAGV